jgi:hypothetical protein
MKHCLFALALAVALSAGVCTAQAAPIKSFIFAQGGYPDGAVVSGFFQGRDDNGDGRITWDYDSAGLAKNMEVTRFIFSFTGNEEMEGFSLSEPGWLDLWEVDPSFEFDYTIGEDTMNLGFRINPGGPDDDGIDPYGNYKYAGDDAGGVLSLWIELGGLPGRPDPTFSTSTDVPLFVTEVPLPTALSLSIAGFAALGALARRK